MQQKQKSFLPGIVLIIVGTFLLLDRMDLLNVEWRDFYPVIMLGISGFFYWGASVQNDKNAPFPAGFFLVLGVFFLLRNYDLFSVDYYFYYPREYWPVFLLATGAGFTGRFLFNRKAFGVLVPAGICTTLGLILLLRNAGFLHGIDFSHVWPLVLIVVGISLILNNLLHKNT